MSDLKVTEIKEEPEEKLNVTEIKEEPEEKLKVTEIKEEPEDKPFAIYEHDAVSEQVLNDIVAQYASYSLDLLATSRDDSVSCEQSTGDCVNDNDGNGQSDKITLSESIKSELVVDSEVDPRTVSSSLFQAETGAHSVFCELHGDCHNAADSTTHDFNNTRSALPQQQPATHFEINPEADIVHQTFASHASESPNPPVCIIASVESLATIMQPLETESSRLQSECEPTIEPINGILQPPVMPRSDRPGRDTNQLRFMHHVVYRAISRHPYAWPFAEPVNCIELNLPDYYQIITAAMDLGTIRQRLENRYYFSASECIADFMTMLNNCYRFNNVGDEVVTMARTLEKLLHSKLLKMMATEVEIYQHQPDTLTGSASDSDAFEIPFSNGHVNVGHLTKAHVSASPMRKTMSALATCKTKAMRTKKVKLRKSASAIETPLNRTSSESSQREHVSPTSISPSGIKRFPGYIFKTLPAVESPLQEANTNNAVLRTASGMATPSTPPSPARTNDENPIGDDTARGVNISALTRQEFDSFVCDCDSMAKRIKKAPDATAADKEISLSDLSALMSETDASKQVVIKASTVAKLVAARRNPAALRLSHVSTIENCGIKDYLSTVLNASFANEHMERSLTPIAKVVVQGSHAAMIQEAPAEASSLSVVTDRKKMNPSDRCDNIAHVCNICSCKYRTKKDLSLHILKHTKEAPFKCQLCAFGIFQTSLELTLHMRDHKHKTNFKCDICGNTFTSKASLIRHMTSHMEQEPLKCVQCSYSCTLKSQLESHIRGHSGETFKCNLCLFSTIHKNALSNHIKVHKREKVYQCAHCSYAVRHKKSLIFHLLAGKH